LKTYLGIGISEYKREWDEIGSALRKADLVIAISKQTQQDVEDWFGVDSEVNYLGVDVETANECLAGFELGQRRKQFCAIGNLYDHKRFDLLVKVFNKLGERFIMMGDGYMRPILERMAELNVILSGAVSERQKFRVMARSLALVHASVCEGFFLPAAEALYCRTPVIAHDLPTLREVYEDKLMYWRSEEELAERIAEVKESKPEGDRDFVLRKKLTLQDCVDRLIPLFRQALSS